MANTNKMKYTAWTNSGIRIEASTGPLVSQIADLYGYLTPEQREQLKAKIAHQDQRLAAREAAQ